MTAKNIPGIEVHPLAAAMIARGCRTPRLQAAGRQFWCGAQLGDLNFLARRNDMNTDLDTPTALAAPGKTRATAPRLRLSSEGLTIDHPDLELGEQLMADALGVADRDAMYGILGQLTRASVSRRKPDPVALAFMISMVESIKPRDSIEAMLVAQMVSVHVLAMRCAHRLAGAQDVVQQESAGRALGRLTRVFPAQIEALNRHRSNGAPAVTVQNVSVQDGGNAIVGNVTQHASVSVCDANAERGAAA
jgi:hypothetical protein